MKWKYSPNAPQSWCNLEPDTDYYVNFMLTEQDSTEQCAATAHTCVLGTVGYHN